MPVTETSSFFKQKHTAAEIKSELLNAYFPDWCALVLNQTTPPAADTIVYVDLLAGPVLNEDATLAGPGLLLNQVYQSRSTDTDLDATVKTFFLDPNKNLNDTLATDIAGLPFAEELTHTPVVLNTPESQEYLAGLLSKPTPGLLAIDPFGNAYAQEVLAQIIRQGQMDILLLFTPAKMRTVAQSPTTGSLAQLFGEQWNQLGVYLARESSARKKEQLITEVLEQGLKAQQYTPATLKINLPDKDQTSHYLVYAARTQPAYFLMKELLATYSDYQPDGIPLFSVNQKQQQPLLPGFFEYLSKYTLAHLTAELSSNRSRFHYRSIQEIYEDHSVGTHFIKANYLQAFAALRDQGQINLVDEENKQVKKLTEAAIVFYKLHGRK